MLQVSTCISSPYIVEHYYMYIYMFLHVHVCPLCMLHEIMYMYFNHTCTEPPRTHSKQPCRPACPCSKVARECSVWSNLLKEIYTIPKTSSLHFYVYTYNTHIDMHIHVYNGTHTHISSTVMHVYNCIYMYYSQSVWEVGGMGGMGWYA